MDTAAKFVQDIIDKVSQFFIIFIQLFPQAKTDAARKLICNQLVRYIEMFIIQFTFDININSGHYLHFLLAPLERCEAQE